MWRTIMIGITCAGVLCPQSLDPHFEVADLRINNSGLTETPPTEMQNGRIRVINVRLKSLIAAGWEMRPDDVYGPAWLNDVRVDLVAKAGSASTSDGDLRLMIRAVLRERMHMMARLEPREQSVWALTVAKEGVKMKPAPMPEKIEDSYCEQQGTAAGGTRLTCVKRTMAGLVRFLPRLAPDWADRRVVDATGLDGAWDFALEWTPRDQQDAGGLTLFGALKTQLGLQMESRKMTIPVIVVDSMDREPGEN